MLEEMLQKLLDNLSDMPLLTLSPTELDAFFERTNNISGQTTHENYLLLLTPEDAARLWSWEKSKVEKYLLKWPGLINDLHNLITAITLTWNELYKTTIACDDLLPILIEVMPRDKAYLAKLSPLLTQAANINKNQSTNFYFTLLNSVAFFYLQDEEPIEKDENLERCQAVIKRLRNANFYAMTSLLITLNNICESEMMEIGRHIYHLLDTCHHHEYDIETVTNSKQELLNAWESKISTMLENMDDPPFCNDGVLSNLVEKYLVYMDLHMAIYRMSRPALHKLNEIVSKTRLYQPLIKHDFDTIIVEPSEVVRHYLKIPLSENSLLSIFSARSMKMNLSTLINFLEAKLLTAESVIEEQRGAITIPPEASDATPRQVTANLRNSA